MSLLLGLEFPPVNQLTEWQPLFLKGSAFEVNKVVLLMWLAVIIVLGLFLVAGRQSRKGLVPSGVQNVVEFGVEFVRNDVILQTIGPEGMGYTPFLVTVFFFVFICNVYEVIPVIQMPVNARMAVPAFLAIVVWAIFNFVGIKSQGLFGYFKSMLFPPGVPKFLLPLVALIELVSTVFVRPFSLAVRLFANMLAGHLLLVSFGVLSEALFAATIVGAVVPFALLVALTGFEVLVAGLQSFIFVILTAVYIGGAMHPEH
ncbi:MAG: F0F1 ATP synthase subunit A [Acidimicrobiales bacterium]